MCLQTHPSEKEEMRKARRVHSTERQNACVPACSIVVLDSRCVTSACRGIFLLLLQRCSFGSLPRMTRGKQKIEAQKRAAEKNEKPKGSQIEARNAGLKTVCSVCKAPLANYKQLVDHFASKHPKEAVPPAPSS